MKQIFLVWMYLLFGSVQASPASYQITQGFSEGATAIARFIGDDIDGDGWLISSGTQEVSAYSMVFTGNSIVPPFDLIEPPGQVASIRLNLFPAGGIIADGPVSLSPDEFIQRAPTFQWHVAPTCTTSAGLTCTGRVSETGFLIGTPSDFSFEAPVVSLQSDQPAPIPIPPTVWLFGSGLLGLTGAGRRIQHNRAIA